MARKSRKQQQAEDIITMAAPTVQAWVYARISKEGDRSDDSIESQIAICKEFIHSGSELSLGGVFTDLGYSGTNFDRPGYADMMAGILCGDVKCVVVKDLSRLGRTYIEVGELLFDTFVQYGIRFVSVNDSYDSFADDAGRKKLLILFKNLVNHMYSRDLGKKIRSVYAAKRQRGDASGSPPYGYRYNPSSKRLEISPEEADVVRMIFSSRLSGESINGITKRLNQSRVPSPKDRQDQSGDIGDGDMPKRIVWNNTFVSRILRNETYTGTLFLGKFDYVGKKRITLPKDQWVSHENSHVAIISKEQYDAVSRLMDVEAEKRKSAYNGERMENRYVGHKSRA